LHCGIDAEASSNLDRILLARLLLASALGLSILPSLLPV